MLRINHTALAPGRAQCDSKRMAESQSSRTAEARKISRNPKELQADRSPLLALQASREDDSHSSSVQNRAQANPTAGRFQTG